MKWCFLISNFQSLPEFFGKLSTEIMAQGDECLVIFGSKFAEYDKKKFFPAGVKFISMVDWQIDNYRPDTKEFHGLLWKEFFPILDRLPHLEINYEKSIEITLKIVAFFEFIFEKEKPDIIASEPPSSLFSLIAYNFALKNNARYLGFEYSRISKRTDVYDQKFTCSKYEKTFLAINAEDISEEEKGVAKDFIKKFISHVELPSYMDFTKIYFSQTGLVKHFIRRIKKVYSPLVRYIFSRSKYKSSDMESESVLRSFLRAIFMAEKKKIKTLWQKRFFKHVLKNPFDSAQGREKYFLYPIHQQPESSTNVYAPYYCNQVNTIKNIALSLPIPCKLYVKEHPVSAGTKPDRFYKELERIPNVVLISPAENLENLVKNSLGIVSLTSTVGLEAALAGKPVYVLGDVFYSYHPLCRKVKNFEDLEKRIKEDSKEVTAPVNLEDINIRFMVSYFRNIIPGGMISAGEQNDINDYQLIHKSVIKLL